MHPNTTTVILENQIAIMKALRYLMPTISDINSELKEKIELTKGKATDTVDTVVSSTNCFLTSPIPSQEELSKLYDESQKESTEDDKVHKVHKFVSLAIEKYPLKHPHAHSTKNAEIIEKRRDFISGLDEGHKIGRISAIREIDKWAQENSKTPKPNTTSGVAYALAHNELLTKLISMLD